MRRRLGMLTPSSNTVLEPQTAAMLSGLPSVTAHFSRFRVTDISVTKASLDQFRPDTMVAAASLLADAHVDAIVWNGTSGGWLGLEHDRALCRAIADRLGTPSTTVTLALVRLLRQAGHRRIAFVTPYTRDVGQRILGTFTTEGFACVEVEPLGISDNFAFSTVPENTLDRLVATAAAGRPDVIVPYCTNLPATAHVARWEAEHGIPVFESVAVAVRGALDLIGSPCDALRAWGRLFAA